MSDENPIKYVTIAVHRLSGLVQHRVISGAIEIETVRDQAGPQTVTRWSGKRGFTIAGTECKVYIPEEMGGPGFGD